MHDAIFAETDWRTASPETYVGYAQELGLDVETFKACLDGKVYNDAIDQDMEEANSFGITGTPGFMVNGRLLAGAQPVDNFAKVFDDELRRAGIEIPVPPGEVATEEA